MTSFVAPIILLSYTLLFFCITFRSATATVSTWESETQALAWLGAQELQLNDAARSRLIEKCLSENWTTALETLVRQSSGSKDTIAYHLLRSFLTQLHRQTETLLRAIEPPNTVERKTAALSPLEDVTRVSPAFQWAESDTTIYIQVKLSYRWSSPGALSVQHENVTLSPTHVRFSGIGTHSTIKKHYFLDLPLYATILPEESDWVWGSVGKLSLTLKKETRGRWPRLLNSTSKISNMHSWLEMEEKIQNEVKKTSTTSSTTATPPSSSPAKNKISQNEGEL